MRLMTFDEKAYNRKWMKRYRIRQAWGRAIEHNHCPVCSMLLTSEYHVDCPYLDKRDKTKPF